MAVPCRFAPGKPCQLGMLERVEVALGRAHQSRASWISSNAACTAAPSKFALRSKSRKRSRSIAGVDGDYFGHFVNSKAIERSIRLSLRPRSLQALEIANISH